SVPGIEVSKVEEANNNQVSLTLAVSDDCEPGFCEVRGLAPQGLSNVTLLRVDSLPQIVEGAEPNHQPENATPLSWNSSVAGTLTAQDIDCYRIEAHQGQKGLFEVEAERLGTAVLPILTLFDSHGVALAQARASKGLGRDARLAFTFPHDGSYLLQIHDNIYAGSDDAVYRIRVRDNGRFATALFPLGGPAGWTMRVEASGGNLDEPRYEFLRLPDQPGTLLESPLFPGPGGSVRAPMQLVVGGEGRNEILERQGSEFTPIEAGQAVCGRIEQPGEVDRYRISSTTEQKLSVSIRAAELGSWLDSVVRVLDPDGKEIAQNDDPGGNNNFQPFNGQPPPPADSRLSFTLPGNGRPYTIEIYDRYGDGGPEYPYRLETGGVGPDFHIKLILDPNSNNRRNVFGGRGPNPVLPGSSGSLNLAPGSSTTLNFLVTGEGPLEPIEIEAEGLPFGVTAEKTTIRTASMQTSARTLPPTGGSITLVVAPNASADLGTLRIVGRSKSAQGVPMTRLASAEVILDRAIYTGVFQPPITRELKEMPLWVVGDTRDAEWRVGFVGPPRPIAIALKEVQNPRILLQGDHVDMGLVLDPVSPPPGTYMVEGMAEGSGVGIQTLVTEMGGSNLSEGQPAAVVRVVAAPDAVPGVRKVTLSLKPLKAR
ncbi:MAG TPA: hypothetical protein VFT74_02695, partial [Isosphaeraceae bacterium]|nr:hypothetical protein [Isosphaeraceae bacterium]